MVCMLEMFFEWVSICRETLILLSRTTLDIEKLVLRIKESKKRADSQR